jgi:hypothetical protein
MKHFGSALIITFLPLMNLIAQSNNGNYIHFFKIDSTYIMVDNNKDHWYTIEFKADTLYQNEDNRIIYNNKKLLQINVIPFSEILPNQHKPIAIAEVLQAYKIWELDYQQKLIKSKLKSGEEFYYRDRKPFLIWWFKNPPESANNTSTANEKEYDFNTNTLVDVKTLNVTHMLCLNFSIYGNKNVALTIPVFEDENLKEEVENLKKIANSLRVYGGNIDLDVLVDIKKTKDKYILRDSLNLLELEVPDWANVIKPIRKNMFGATFPEYHEVVNAMMMLWEYKSDSLTFDDFINRSKSPHEMRPNYKLIEKTDSTYKYFYTSDNGWYYQQNVYLKGDNIYCLINFTATNNTYEDNITRFDEIIKKIKLNKKACH